MLDFFVGAKTFLGGLVLVGGGAAGLAFGVMDPFSAAALVGNGFAVWGIGGKVEGIAKSLATKDPTFKVEGASDGQ